MPADDVPALEESALDGLLLSNSDLNKIAGVDVESLYSAEEMNDNADLVSDLDCLGAIYPGEDAVYDETDWTAIRDELLLEASGEDDGRASSSRHSSSSIPPTTPSSSSTRPRTNGASARR